MSLQGLRAGVTALAWLVFGCWSLVLAAWLVLHWGILPRIDTWRPQIQAEATQRLGTPVELGQIIVRSRGWVPSLELRDVVLRDAQQRVALHLPRVLAAVSVRSLLSLKPRLEQLMIEGADLQLRLDAQGRLHVGGLVLDAASTGAAGSDDALDWLLHQHEFVVRGGRVQWTDELHAAPPVALQQVDFVLRNTLRRHEMRLDATPPPELGQRVSLRARFHRPLFSAPAQWRRWSGTIYAELPAADLGQIAQRLALPLSGLAGHGALRGWAEAQEGRLTALSADMALRDAAWQWVGGLAPLAFRQLQGTLDLRRDAEGLRLAARGLSFTTDDGLDWPRSDLALRLDQPGEALTLSPLAAPVRGGEFSAGQLDLGLLGRLAARTPLPPALQQWLAEAAVQGAVRDLAGRWAGPPQAPERYSLRARVQGLAVAAASAAAPGPDGVVPIGRPGVRNASIQLQATEAGGQARLEIGQGALSFPGVFEQAEVPLRRLQADLSWRITPGSAGAPGPALSVTVRNAEFANDDAEGRLQGQWHTGPGAGFGVQGRFPGQLQLSGQLDRGLATRVARYLPLALPLDTRRYVQHAVTGGQVRRASFQVKGDLAQFPFTAQPESVFRVAAQVDDVTLAYVPSLPPLDGAPAYTSPWPAFTRVSGELVFDRASMAIRDARAWVQGFELSRVEGQIRELGDRSVLEIQGSGRGPLADALRYVQGSPIGQWTGPILRQAIGNGMADLRLALNLPLHDTRLGTVRGTVQLGGNDLRLGPQLPLLAAARGTVEFSQDGLQVHGGVARLLGGETSFDGGTQSDGRLKFVATGTATAEALRRVSEWPSLARAAAVLQGQAPYRLVLGLSDGPPELLLTSTLQGMAVDLPEPLRKPAESTLALRLQAAPAGPGQDNLRLELGGMLQAQVLRSLDGPEPRVLRGAVALREPLALPESGVRAQLKFDRLALDEWRAAAQRLWPASGSTGVGAGAAGVGVAVVPSAYLPTAVQLSARELWAGERRFDAVQAELRRSERQGETWWQARVQSEQLAGQLDLRPAADAAVPWQVNARLSRLWLPAAPESASWAAAAPERAEAAASPPPGLDIVAEDFRVRGLSLGRLELVADSRGSGDAREWRLQRLNLAVPEAELRASGRYVAAQVPRRRRTEMEFRLELNDSGAYVDRLGLGRALRGGKGELGGTLAWAGAPNDFAPDALSGQMALKLAGGQFLNAEPGMGRLLGMLNLQALPRRLSLDFRDVFDSGFAFDSVAGDIQVAEGVARTQNLRMHGVQAGVLMAGSANLADETQDLRVIVVPDLDASTASLAYAAINPAVGLGTYLAQLFLRRPLTEAGTREYHVSGAWAAPVVARVDRRAADAAAPPKPAAAASAPAASTP